MPRLPEMKIDIGGDHQQVLIYLIKKEKENDLPGFIKTEVKEFLCRLGHRPARADYWTIPVGDLLLLICLIGAYGNDDWNGVQNIRDYLETTVPIRLDPHTDWQFLKTQCP